MNILLVALGGALGAVCRYGISRIPFMSSYPIATFLTNLMGALLIGFIVGVSEKKNVSDNVLLFSKTGFCGGFTTFSTFSLESVSLLNEGKYIVGGTYIILSLVLCVIGVVFGQYLAKKNCLKEIL